MYIHIHSNNARCSVFFFLIFVPTPGMLFGVVRFENRKQECVFYPLIRRSFDITRPFVFPFSLFPMPLAMFLATHKQPHTRRHRLTPTPCSPLAALLTLDATKKKKHK